MNPADNPAETERMKRDDEDTDVEDTQADENAANNNMNEKDDTTMLDEMDTVLPGANPLENLDVSQIGPATYRVMSARNGGVTTHKVNVSSGSCTCEDMEYNREGNEACAHLSKALLAHPARMSPQESAMWSVMQAQDNIYTLQEQAEDLFDKLEDKRIEQLSNGNYEDDSGGDESQNVEGTGQPVRNPSGQSSGEPAVDPHEAADDLKAAYDDVVQGMQVEVMNGDVWVQTGRDTPDTLPGPGNVQVFEAFLKNPEQVVYDPDAAEAGDSPGQWWKNRIDPQDVDSYIQEVLK